jgi:hypothetical protein
MKLRVASHAEGTTLQRRRMWSRLATTAALALAAACLDLTDAPREQRSVESLAIRAENLQPGSFAWDAELLSGADSNVSGYGVPFSLRAGDTLHLFVTAAHSPGSISIYRLGWYDGVGARLLAQHVNLALRSQGACSAPTPGPSVCDWSETDRFIIDPDWTPGVYLAKFADSLGRARAFPFVVRSDHPAALVVVLPFATYQAYNAWGGTNLYRGPGLTPAEAYAARAVKVSFARPFDKRTLWGHILGLDYVLVRWLEQNAYDATYMTDYDFHGGLGGDSATVAWLFAGHSEYWTWPMWLRANAARNQGINLAFLGGNDSYWVTRFETVSVNGLETPVVVCYRDRARDPYGSTPGLSTVRFRSAPNSTPENSLVGIMSVGGLMRDPPVDLVVKDGSDPLMAGTGLRTGARIAGVAGWEADRIVNNGATPPGTRVLFETPYIPVGDTVASALLQATIYTSPASGALVFAAGQQGFAWGLSTYRPYVASPPLQQFLRNLLEAFRLARNSH